DPKQAFDLYRPLRAVRDAGRNPQAELQAKFQKERQEVDQTIEALLPMCLETRWRENADRDEIRRQFERYVLPHGLKDTPGSRITDPALIAMRDQIIANHGSNGQPGYATARNVWSRLSVFFEWCHRDRKLIAVNPMSGVTPPKKGKPRQRT